MTEKEIIELLKSGNFTIAGHDHGSFALYKGRHSYERLPKNSVTEFEDWNGEHGYITEIIRIFVKALGGKTDSI